MKGNRDYASEIICTQDFMKIHFTWNTSKAKNDEDPRDPVTIFCSARSLKWIFPWLAY